MCMLVTGSSGHLGKALVHTLRDRATAVTGPDIRPSQWTEVVGSVADADVACEVMAGVDFALHAATDAGVRAFVMSSSTTVFGER